MRRGRRSTRAMSTPETSSLSAVVSRNEPSLLVTPQRRASRPSTQSVAAAMQNSTVAATVPSSLSSVRTSHITIGVRAILAVVPTARKRAERTPPRVTVGVATQRADATARRRSRTSGRCAAGAACRRPPARQRCCAAAAASNPVSRSAALTAGIRPAAMLSSRTPSPASSTAASGSPASSPQTPTQRPCSLGGGGHRGDQGEHRRAGVLEQRRERRVPALRRHRVLREVVRPDGEEVHLGRELGGLQGESRAPRP